MMLSRGGCNILAGIAVGPYCANKSPVLSFRDSHPGGRRALLDNLWAGSALPCPPSCRPSARTCPTPSSRAASHEGRSNPRRRSARAAAFIAGYCIGELSCPATQSRDVLTRPPAHRKHQPIAVVAWTSHHVRASGARSDRPSTNTQSTERRALAMQAPSHTLALRENVPKSSSTVANRRSPTRVPRRERPPTRTLRPRHVMNTSCRPAGIRAVPH